MICIQNQLLFKVELRWWKQIKLLLGLLGAKVINWKKIGEDLKIKLSIFSLKGNSEPRRFESLPLKAKTKELIKIIVKPGTTTYYCYKKTGKFKRRN